VRVAYFTEIFPSTTETWVHHEITELIQLGCDVRIFSSWDRPEIRTPSDAKLASLTLYQNTISTLEIPRGLLALARPRFLAKLIPAILSDRPSLRQTGQLLRDFIRFARFLGSIRAFRPQFTVCHFAGTRSNLGLMLQWLDGTPCAIKSHALDVFSGAALFSTKVNQAARFYTISQYNVDFIAEHYPNADTHRIGIHGCGIPLDVLSFQPNEINQTRDCPDILSVGRLVPMKGFDVLISASKLLKDQGVDHRITIIGEGPQEDALKDQAAKLGVGKHFEFKGYRTPVEVRTALYSASVFVLPSLWDGRKGTQDGIPVALIESMACGTLAISSRLSGIPELIEDGVSGLLTEPGDSHALAEAIHAALFIDESKHRGMITRARETVENQHDIQKLTQELLNDMLKIIQ
jgi:glycosyltransferase involved in cell wall biosynthesis